MDDWMDKGLCTAGDVDPEMFFPSEIGGVPDRMAIRTAKGMCAQCPVTNECLTLAMERHIHIGIWGGLTPAERHELTRYGRRLVAV